MSRTECSEYPGTYRINGDMNDEDRAAWWWHFQLGGLGKWTFKAMEGWGF